MAHLSSTRALGLNSGAVVEEEDELFVLWFYTVISLGSLKKKEKQKLKKLFIYWVIENI